MDSYDWLGEMRIDALVQIAYELFIEEFAKEMEMYILAGNNYNQRVDSPEFERFFLDDEENQREMAYAKCNYVLNFIMDNLVLMRGFNDKPTRNNLRKVYRNYVKCAHDACLVLKTSYDGVTCLLTGDASKKVFNRLIREQTDISATYLKMPHHGSKHNMNRKILKKINPKTAIISHANGHFGKSKDTHPNQEILDLLQKERVNILITNDVKKGGYTIMKKCDHRKDTYVDILDL